MKPNRGFTLVEMMVTIAILAILIAIATPSFTRMIQDSRVTTQANDLLLAMTLARSEAIKRAEDVSVSPEGADFDSGWCVHTGAACSAATAIREHEGLSLVVLADSPGAALVFDSLGRKTSPTSDQTFAIDPTACTAGEGRRRVLTVTDTGRASVTTASCS